MHADNEPEEPATFPMGEDDDRHAPVQTQAPAPTTAPEERKLCCICGVDVSHKQRHRDRGGRYWCAFCQNFCENGEKGNGTAPCPDCGRDTRKALMVEQGVEKVCRSCHEIYKGEFEHRAVRKAAVIVNPELQIRRRIRQLIMGVLGLLAAGLLLTLYHNGLLFVRPKTWVPYLVPLILIGVAVVAALIAVAIQHLRIALRKRARAAAYDEMVRSAVNRILALDEDSHSVGIIESPEPLRRRAERAISRLESAAGQGISGAADILEPLVKSGDPTPLIHFLLDQRPNTTDTVARNREIATICYLQGGWSIANNVITAILLRLQFDQEALNRQALIAFRTGQLDLAKKMFKRVIITARENKSELDEAAAYCNLGMLHIMQSEFDDADVRYNQALAIYNRFSREDGQADCYTSLAFIAYRQKTRELAEERIRKALTLNRRHKRREGMAICCGLLGVILLEEPPKLKEAEKSFNEAAELNLDLGRPGGVATAYGNLGLVHVKRNDIKGARELFNKALAIFQRNNRPKMAAKIQAMLKTVSTVSTA